MTRSYNDLAAEAERLSHEIASRASAGTVWRLAFHLGYDPRRAPDAVRTKHRWIGTLVAEMDDYHLTSAGAFPMEYPSRAAALAMSVEQDGVRDEHRDVLRRLAKDLVEASLNN